MKVGVIDPPLFQALSYCTCTGGIGSYSMYICYITKFESPFVLPTILERWLKNCDVLIKKTIFSLLNVFSI